MQVTNRTGGSDYMTLTSLLIVISCRYDEKESENEEEPSFSDGIVYQVVSSLRVYHQPAGASDYEVFDVQPKIQALDNQVCIM